MISSLDIICPTVHGGGVCTFVGCIFRHDPHTATAEDINKHKLRQPEDETHPAEGATTKRPLESGPARVPLFKRPRAALRPSRAENRPVVVPLLEFSPTPVSLFDDESFQLNRKLMLRRLTGLLRQRNMDHIPEVMEAELAGKMLYNAYNHCMNQYLDTLLKGGTKRYVYDLEFEYQRVRKEVETIVSLELPPRSPTVPAGSATLPVPHSPSVPFARLEPKVGADDLQDQKYTAVSESQNAVVSDGLKSSKGEEWVSSRAVPEMSGVPNKPKLPEGSPSPQLALAGDTERVDPLVQVADAVAVPRATSMAVPQVTVKGTVKALDVPLAPIPVLPNAPATTSQRALFILELVKVIKAQYPRYATPVRMACRKEYAIAVKTSSFTYGNTIKGYIFRLKKGQESLVAAKGKDPSVKTCGMIERLTKEIIPVATLKAYGYVMELPLAPETVPGFRLCVRCGTRFNSQKQMDPTTCLFHPKRLYTRKVERTGADNLAKTYECCGNGHDSLGCCTSAHHVFKPEDPRELHALIPFIHTSDFDAAKPNPNCFKALGVDCEMGYTTMGFEAIRVTFVDYLTGKTVYDTLVKPQGVVIDLNTQFSGVSSIPLETPSFEDVFRKRIFQYMDRHTVLIGHGLENDVNVMRIIHERVVDTSVLYPKNLTANRYRKSLKQLAFQYLSRVIQTGEHDSSEDALAAMDIVKYHLERHRPPQA